MRDVIVVFSDGSEYNALVENVTNAQVNEHWFALIGRDRQGSKRTLFIAPRERVRYCRPVKEDLDV